MGWAIRRSRSRSKGGKMLISHQAALEAEVELHPENVVVALAGCLAIHLGGLARPGG